MSCFSIPIYSCTQCISIVPLIKLCVQFHSHTHFSILPIKLNHITQLDSFYYRFEFSTERTVEMCRNEGVKSILASRDFKDPREVVAKLIVEQTSQEKEKQILFYNRGGYQKQNKPFFKKNGYNNGYNKKGNDFNRSNNGNGNSFKGRSNRGRFGNRGGGNRQYNVRVAENCDVPSDNRRENNPSEPAFTVERVSRA